MPYCVCTATVVTYVGCLGKYCVDNRCIWAFSQKRKR